MTSPAAPPPQVFVRTDKGQTFGPLAPSTVELLVDNGALQGKFQISLDGQRYAYIGNLPDVRDFFPRTLWAGDTEAARAAPPAASAPVIVPSAPAASTVPGPPVSTGRPGERPSSPPVLGPAAAASVVPGPPSNIGPPPRTSMAPPTIAPTAVPPSAPSVAAPKAQAAPSASAAPSPPPPTPSAAIKAPVPPLPASGDLTQTSALRLYALAAAGDVSGLIDFTLSDRTVSVHFRKGSAELVSSTHAEDSVGAFLLAQKLLKDEQLKEAEANRGRFGDDLVATLFGLAILNPGTAFAPLAQRSIGILLKAIAASTGTFTFAARELNASKVLPLGNRWSVLGDLLRRIQIPELRRRMQDVFESPVMKSGGWVNIADLKLTPQETRSFGYFDGVRPLSQLVKDHPMDADNLLRLALLLREVDGVSFTAPLKRPEPVHAPPPSVAPAAAMPSGPPMLNPQAVAAAPSTAPKPPAAAAHPRPAPGAPVLKPAAPVVTAAVISQDGVDSMLPGVIAEADAVTVGVIEGDEGFEARRAPAAPIPEVPRDFDSEIAPMKARALQIKKENHFQVLGIPENADGNAVKLAYFKLAKLHHPDTVPDHAPPELGKLKAELFSAIGEAYRQLQDDKNRAEYLAELKSGGSAEVDIEKILHAEELFQKGSILVKARKYPEAVKMLDDAIKANGDEAEFWAWRGYAKYFAAADKKAALAESINEIKKTLLKNERCAPAHYFLGHIAKMNSDTPTALREFKRTVELDSRHIDAQREIRMLQGVKK